MGWREEFARLTGPGLIMGISLGDLIDLLFQNRFQVPFRYWPKAAFAGGVSLITTSVRHVEEAVYSRRMTKQPVLPPLFIIGHWRWERPTCRTFCPSTACAFANFAQLSIPHTFLLGEPLLAAGEQLLLLSRSHGHRQGRLEPARFRGKKNLPCA